MSRSTIHIHGVDSLVRHIDHMRAKLTVKSPEIAGEIADVIRDKAEDGYSEAESEIHVDVTRKGTRASVTAEGEEVTFYEFGAGVYYNGSISPHPKAAELGFRIGEYGKGKGKQKAWGYKGKDGNLVITRGTKATLAMYNASKVGKAKAEEIARRKLHE